MVTSLLTPLPLWVFLNGPVAPDDILPASDGKAFMSVTFVRIKIPAGRAYNSERYGRNVTNFVSSHIAPCLTKQYCFVPFCSQLPSQE